MMNILSVEKKTMTSIEKHLTSKEEYLTSKGKRPLPAFTDGLRASGLTLIELSSILRWILPRSLSWIWMRRLRRSHALLAFYLIGTGLTAFAQKPAPDLTNASLEDLMKMEVTSVSKKEEKLFGTAAAIYVITREEIRRSGAYSLPEILRLAPGLEVAHIDGNKWAVTARGFNGRFANKLLVLIDGRTIYSPETSGVYWEVQDLLLEDIERIEVIRGPGGTLWGSNAVNGVINIITRRARDTQGGLLVAGGGSQEQGFGGMRYGGQIGDNAYYRLYAKYFHRAGLVDSTGRDVNDGQRAIRGGGRLDWTWGKRDSFSVEGDIYGSKVRDNFVLVLPADLFAPHGNTPGDYSGGNVQGHWNHSFSSRSETALRIYYDRFNRDAFDLPESVDTFDLDFQHHLALGKRNDLVWGAGYRLVWLRSDSTPLRPVQFEPSRERINLFNVFAQDEVTLIKDRLRLVVGAKLERTKDLAVDPSTVDVQPNARVSWTPGRTQTIWASVSRAVRSNSPIDENIRVNAAAIPQANGLPLLISLFGSQDFKQENLLAYEIGYRRQVSRRISVDLASFYNFYNNLKTQEPRAPFVETIPTPHLVIPLVFANLMKGESYGAEASVNVNVSNAWKLSGSYSFLRIQLRRDAASRDTTSEMADGLSPRHQFQIHSLIKLGPRCEFDAALYRVSQISFSLIPAYTRADLRFGWQPTEGVEISAGGKNLGRQHPEFGGLDSGISPSQVKPSAYGKVTWHF